MEDLRTSETWRVFRIQSELIDGIESLHNLGAAVSIFGSSRLREDSPFYQAAQRVARTLADAGLSVITGGGPGVMEAANRGASDVGAESVGLNIVLPFEQRPNEYITPYLCFNFHYFALRKLHFMMRAVALVVFPGGFGTLDELFEVLTLIQTRKIKPIPVLLFGQDYWERIINFPALVEEGVINRSDLEIFSYVETAERAWAILEPALKAYARRR